MTAAVNGEFLDPSKTQDGIEVTLTQVLNEYVVQEGDIATNLLFLFLF